MMVDRRWAINLNLSEMVQLIESDYLDLPHKKPIFSSLKIPYAALTHTPDNRQSNSSRQLHSNKNCIWASIKQFTRMQKQLSNAYMQTASCSC